MSMDRFDEVTIGHACEVEGCSIVCTSDETRCYDHSVMRLIGTLFNEEKCRFGGVTCTHQATTCNESGTPMCETCYNIFRRIQRGRMGYDRYGDCWGYRAECPHNAEAITTVEGPHEVRIPLCRLCYYLRDNDIRGFNSRIREEEMRV